MEVNRGGRPKKVQVQINDEGLKEILQKVYVESEDLRQKSLLVFNKAVRKMKDTQDIAIIGKTTAEYLKIAQNATISKLNVAKIVQDHIIKGNKSEDSNGVDGNEFVITDEMKEEIALLHSQLAKDYEKLPQGGELTDVNEALNKIEEKEMNKIKKNDSK